MPESSPSYGASWSHSPTTGGGWRVWRGSVGNDDYRETWLWRAWGPDSEKCGSLDDEVKAIRWASAAAVLCDHGMHPTAEGIATINEMIGEGIATAMSRSQAVR